MGGRPDRFLTIIVFNQKFFVSLFDFSVIFSISLKVVTSVIEYSVRNVNIHLIDTILLTKIHELLFIDEIAMIFFISKFCLNRARDAAIVPMIMIITMFISDCCSCRLVTSAMGRIFCHVMMIIIDLCFISSLEINFMYQPCSGHIPVFPRIANVTSKEIIVLFFVVLYTHTRINIDSIT